MAYGITQSLDLEASSSQYASISDASQTGLDVASSFTIEAWINLESLPGSGGNYDIAGKFGSAARQYHFYFVNSLGTYQLGTEIGDPNGGACNNNASGYLVNWTPTIATWYHVAMVKSGINVQFYVGAVPQGSAGGTFPANICNGSASFDVGRNGFASGFFDGKTSLLRVWNTARTQSELASNMCNVLGPTAGLVGEWTFNNVYTDNSGNSNTLTPTNSPTFASDFPAVCIPAFNPAIARRRLLI